MSVTTLGILQKVTGFKFTKRFAQKHFCGIAKARGSLAFSMGTAFRIWTELQFARLYNFDDRRVNGNDVAGAEM
jgi:hypothetical protein